MDLCHREGGTACATTAGTSHHFTPAGKKRDFCSNSRNPGKKPAGKGNTSKRPKNKRGRSPR